MPGDYFRVLFGVGGKTLADRLCDAEVQFPASGLEQPFISGVLNQCVLELIGGFRSDAARIDELWTSLSKADWRPISSIAPTA